MACDTPQGLPTVVLLLCDFRGNGHMKSERGLAAATPSQGRCPPFFPNRIGISRNSVPILSFGETSNKCMSAWHLQTIVPTHASPDHHFMTHIFECLFVPFELLGETGCASRAGSGASLLHRISFSFCSILHLSLHTSPAVLLAPALKQFLLALQ